MLFVRLTGVVCALLLVALSPLAVRAANFTVSCTAPTNFVPVCRAPTDCDPPAPIPAATSFVFKLYKPATATPKISVDTLLDTGSVCTFARTNVAPGTYTHYATASVDGLESDPSDTVTKIVAVTALSVSSPTAYTLVKETDKFVFLPVGTVPVATFCDATQRVIDRYVVPRATVTFTGSVRPVVVLAFCQ